MTLDDLATKINSEAALDNKKMLQPMCGVDNGRSE
jgi:hypothetical protein|tara:strand:- start:1326 stop:1430 length:105 start_codon:yes stop_codon:yes gene_type:complete